MSNIKNVRINTIQRAGVSAAQRLKNPNAVGNILINGEWVSSIEWRNNLLGAGLPTDIALPTFLGSNVTFRVLEITQEMLTAGGGTHIEKLNGRDVTFKQPGKYNVEMKIDFSTMTVTDNALNLNKLVQMLGAPRRNNQVSQAPVVQQRPADLPEELLAPSENEIGDPVVETITDTPVVEQQSLHA